MCSLLLCQCVSYMILRLRMYSTVCPHLALVCVELLEMQQTLLGGITEDV